MAAKRGKPTPGLTFQISKQSKGAQKAHKAFIKEYGRDEGQRIYLAKARQQGQGTTIEQQVNSTYKTGTKL